MPNHLTREKSPYLQQHAQNPVDWYPWSAEAFHRAEAEDRPVFLSIGYATCHWCHVMARESFEDPKIAALLNKDFVSVKVDREERPDIDSVYMAACQQMTGQGGWPLTIIMTSDKKPFFAGTYLPPTTRGGMAGLSEILKKVTDLWKNDRGMLLATGEQIIPLLARTAGESAHGSAGLSLIHDGYDDLAVSFDRLHGGFGRAPKFPAPARILFLLRYWKRTGSGTSLRMAEQTLEAMRCGGIHDHVGGGFHRYSTDAAWRVPHFEKMLCDQALFLMAYTEAWQATKNPLWQKTAEGIITYVLRDLQSPDGAFISAEDADSPGGEGAYYLWTRREFSEALKETDAAYAAALFHVKEQGNFSGSEEGRNILYLTPGNGSPGAGGKIASILKALHTARQKRPRPLRDGKILTDWNGLMIAALAQASFVFQNPAWYHAAASAMHFILRRLRGSGGRLLHRWYDGEAAVPAFADDYASVILGLIGLYEAGFEPAWLGEAERLNDILTEHFSDPDTGGFFTIPDDGEPLIARKMEIHDGAIPSANSLMLRNLILLGHLSGNPVHEERASRLADAFAGTVGCNPSAYSAFLSGLDHLLGPAMDVVIAGEEADPLTREMIRLLRERYLPSCTLQLRTAQTSPALDTLAPFTAAMTPRDGTVTVYVCTGRSCSVPLTSPAALLNILEKNLPFRGS